VEKAKLELKSRAFSLATVDLNYSMNLDPEEEKRFIDRGSYLLSYIKDHYPELPCLVITSSKKTATEGYEFAIRFGTIVKGFFEKSDEKIVEKLLKKIEELLAVRLSDHEPQLASAPEPITDREIFISYAWGGESEAMVNRLDETFQEKGVMIIRDKRDLGFKGRIKAFMEQIGRGKAVIVVISEKYLKSENCMFELVQIAKNGQFYDRIFPIVLADARIYKPIDRAKYIKYWDQQIQELNQALKSIDSAANLPSLYKDINLYTEIRNTIDGLIDILRDMNTLTPEMHSESNFEALFKAVERTIG
jgi:hypothetical protein